LREKGSTTFFLIPFLPLERRLFCIRLVRSCASDIDAEETNFSYCHVGGKRIVGGVVRDRDREPTSRLRFCEDLMLEASNLKFITVKTFPRSITTMLTRSQFDAACNRLIAKYATFIDHSPVTDALKGWVWKEHPVSRCSYSIYLYDLHLLSQCQLLAICLVV